MKTKAQRAMADVVAKARANDRGIAVVEIQHGDSSLLLEYRRHSREYEVGTIARVMATGPRAKVLAALESALA